MATAAKNAKSFNKSFKNKEVTETKKDIAPDEESTITDSMVTIFEKLSNEDVPQNETWDSFTPEELNELSDINPYKFTQTFHKWLETADKKLFWPRKKSFQLRTWVCGQIREKKQEYLMEGIIIKMHTGKWGEITEEELQILAFDYKVTWHADITEWCNNNGHDAGFWTKFKCHQVKSWAFLKINYQKMVDQYEESKSNSRMDSYNCNPETNKMIQTVVTFKYNLLILRGKDQDPDIVEELQHGKYIHYEKSAPANWKKNVKNKIISQYEKNDRRGNPIRYKVNIFSITIKKDEEEREDGYESDNEGYDFYYKDTSFKKIQKLKKPEEPTEMPDIYD